MLGSGLDNYWFTFCCRPQTLESLKLPVINTSLQTTFSLLQHQNHSFYLSVDLMLSYFAVTSDLKQLIINVCLIIIQHLINLLEKAARNPSLRLCTTSLLSFQEDIQIL